ncbi:uncharacterized protein LOC114933222 isoform X3 [Nylanderia fulva]|uniref:uncharacterized protein LOC114933222 isoform X3 n=1 Tax=Nylanderia fulva TaxID=613905 RepID=UPI0010FAE098|nr:uncharacterized protein LOC114933222 isoform X3 [Nylanderia fulva]
MCLPLLFKMTPTFCWVFLLVCLVGRVASVPQDLVVDACALICNSEAETESERERNPSLYPRYPKVDCKLQSDNDKSQAWVIMSNCLKLCNVELSVNMEVNCYALRMLLATNLGCYCEDWKMKFLVKQLSNDLLTTILDSPRDKLIICEIHKELFNSTKLAVNKFSNCYPKQEAVSAKKEDNKKDQEDEESKRLRGKPYIFLPSPPFLPDYYEQRHNSRRKTVEFRDGDNFEFKEEYETTRLEIEAAEAEEKRKAEAAQAEENESAEATNRI